MRWLKALPVKHLAFAHHAEEITRQNFDHQLDVMADVAVVEIYSADIAPWFAKEHHNAPLAPESFDPAIGFNDTVWVPAKLIN